LLLELAGQAFCGDQAGPISRRRVSQTARPLHRSCSANTAQASLDWYDRAIRALEQVREKAPRDADAKQALSDALSDRAVAWKRLTQYSEAIAPKARAATQRGAGRHQVITRQIGAVEVSVLNRSCSGRAGTR
jgi:hypothetical protein